MHFFLYFPDREMVGNEELRDLGLGNLIDGTGPGWRTIPGPNGGNGALATWTPEGKSAPFVVDDKQEWMKHPGSPRVDEGRYWFGFYPNDLPCPDDLKKTDQLDSLPAVLDDGNSWEIPIARYLPHANCWDVKSGKYNRQVVEQYKSFWEMSEKFATQFFEQLELLEVSGLKGNLGIEIPMELTWDYCVRALEMNYRLSNELIQWFGLLKSDVSIIRLLIATVELPMRLEMLNDQKKTELPERIGAPVAQFI